MRFSALVAAVLAASVITVAAEPVEAQGLGDRLKRKAKERIDQKTDQGMDKALDKAEATVKCAATDTACIEKAKAEGKKVETTGAAPAAASGSVENAAASPEAPAAAFVNFDFVPGERVLFAEDLTKDNVGDFPRRLEFVKGNLEVAEFRGGRWLRATTDGAFIIPLPEALPERFTLEFDHIGQSWSYPHLTVHFGNDVDERGQSQQTYDIVVVQTGHTNGAQGGIFDPHNDKRSAGESAEKPNEPFPVRVMVDGKYAKVYFGGTRVANIPNANLGRADRIVVRFDAEAERPSYFANFRVAAGGRKLYEALNETGRVATQGIYFATGSDRLRPESAPTLKEIAAMLKEHGDLSLTIEGHTDNVGNAAANQTLSEARAAAVKAALVADYGIEAGRLTTAGFGASKPAGSNDTAEGRQTNRRVELVKK